MMPARYMGGSPRRPWRLPSPAPVSAPDHPPLPAPGDLERALLADRADLRKLLGKVRRAAGRGEPHDRNLRRLVEGLAASTARREARAAAVPPVTYPDELPVSARRQEVAAALREHQVVVVCGETGSGKSTQLPKLLLELGYGVDGLIGHTQPRRLAARSLARRVAEELGVPLGRQVGFKVRFGDETGDDTLIKLMTDGVLLAETRRDPQLLAYDALILDEAHERSLNIDFLLGYLHRLLPRRPALRVVITSATIEPQRFAEHFAKAGVPAPVIEVSGRTYPVEVRWRPVGGEPADTSEGDARPPLDGDGLDGSDSGDLPAAGEREPRTAPARGAAPAAEPDVLGAVADAVEEAAAEGPGDVLVFLPTERDIHEAAQLLRGRRFGGRPAEVLPLYARLPPEAQQRLFAAHDRRRIVLSTNVAETSLTVPGITTVIDTGTARVSRWSPRARMQRLPIEPVSRASAEQRKGRCGRIGPGLCIRLYSEADHLARDEQPTPEIQRSNLARVMLTMADLGLGEMAEFPFLDPPRRAMVADALGTLTELGALDEQGAITAVGRQLARLPVDPRIGRMILSAHDEGCLADVLIIAAALETNDPRMRPPGKERAARAAHGKLLDGDSDFISLLTLWDHARKLREGRSRSQWQSALDEQFLSPARLREWADVHGQLRELVGELGLEHGRRVGDRHPIHRALLSGLLSYVAWRKDKSEYQAADGKALWLWPGSALFDKRPRWIVAAEIVETSRRWARTVARVDPQMIEELAGPLLQRAWRDPWWDRKSGHVLAHEKVLLHNMPLVPRRRARYDRVDPVIARELFLRHALAEGDLDTDAPFLRHNLGLANELAALEARTRRRGLLADLDARYDFYDRIVPPEVVGATSFQRWRRKAEKHDRELLFMTRADLLREDPGAEAEQLHPDHIEAGGLSLPLRYRLEPGAEDDGVTATVALADLPRVDARRLEWLVPGLLREKLIALVRGLPKDLRRPLVPVPTRVDEAMVLMQPGQGALLPAFARALQRIAGQPIPARAFDPSRLMDALRMRVEVVDDQGRVLAAGRDVAALREQLGRQTALAEAELSDPRWRQDGLVRWDFGALPESVGLPDGRRGFPALLDPADAAAADEGRGAGAGAGGSAGAGRTPDPGRGVSLRLLPTAAAARVASERGVARLLELAVGGAIVHRLQRRPEWTDMALHHATLGSAQELQQRLVARVVREAFLSPAPRVRNAEQYGALLAAGRDRLVSTLDALVPPMARALAESQALRATLDELAATPLAPLIPELGATLDGLLGAEALLATPTDRLPHLPRYIAALARRLERVRQRGTTRDAELAARVAPWDATLAGLQAQAARAPSTAPSLPALRWMVEEFRVSVFAQELGTHGKVSEKRLGELAARVRAELAR